MPRLADDLQRAADPVADVERSSVGGETGKLAGELDDQALAVAALQPQAAKVGLHVADFNGDFEGHDVGVVPNRGRGHIAHARTSMPLMVLLASWLSRTKGRNCYRTACMPGTGRCFGPSRARRRC